MALMLPYITKCNEYKLVHPSFYSYHRCWWQVRNRLMAELHQSALPINDVGVTTPVKSELPIRVYDWSYMGVNVSFAGKNAKFISCV